MNWFVKLIDVSMVPRIPYELNNYVLVSTFLQCMLSLAMGTNSPNMELEGIYGHIFLSFLYSHNSKIANGATNKLIKPNDLD